MSYTPIIFFNNKTPVSVKDFGAKGDGVTDDTSYINAAISSISATGGVLYFPLGNYVITSQLRIDFSNCKIDLGGSTLVINTSTPSSSFIPILAMGQTTVNDPPVIKNFILQNGTIQLVAAGVTDGSFVQLNNVTGALLSNINIIGDGLGMHSSKTDGIALGLDTQDVLIEKCIVQGLSKAGIYLSGCSYVTVSGCVVKDGYESINPYTTGISLGACSNCIISNSQIYNNRGVGAFCAGIAPITSTLSTLTNQTHFRITVGVSVGTFVMGSIAVFNTTTKRYELLNVASATPVDGTSQQQWDIVLNQAPSQTLSGSMTVYLNLRLPHAIQFIGCSFVNNIAGTGGGAQGALIGSAAVGAEPYDLIFDGCIISGSTQGFSINQCSGARFVNCTASNCVIGLIMQDVGPGTLYPDGTAAENTCRKIDVLGGAYYDNTDSNIWLQSVNDCSVMGSRIYHTNWGGGEVGIRVLKQTVVTVDKPCYNLKIIDPIFFGYPYINAAVYQPTTADVPANGAPGDVHNSSYYRVFWPDVPGPTGGLFPAPIGSQWIDTNAGNMYVKHGADLSSENNDSAKWTRQHTDIDSISLTQNVRSWSGSLSLQSAAGGNVFAGDPNGNYVAFTPSNTTWVIPGHAWLETSSPAFAINQRTSDAVTHNFSFSGQAPYSSATGTNRDSGGFQFAIPPPISGGNFGLFRITFNGIDQIRADGYNVFLLGNAGLGNGTGVISIANATVVPSTNASGGGILYVEGGALKYRGSSGTITVLGPA